jgi:hypothetical protein
MCLFTTCDRAIILYKNQRHREENQLKKNVQNKNKNITIWINKTI